jgi:hypothetical protein
MIGQEQGRGTHSGNKTLEIVLKFVGYSSGATHAAAAAAAAAAAPFPVKSANHSTSAAVTNTFIASMALRRTRTLSPTCRL